MNVNISCGSSSVKGKLLDERRETLGARLCIYLGILYHTAGLIHISYKDYIHIPHVPFVRIILQGE